MLTGLEEGRRPQVELGEARVVPVVGITGPGGAGKSSLTDELLMRFRYAFGAKHLAVLSIDPQETYGWSIAGRPHSVDCCGYRCNFHAVDGHASEPFGDKRNVAGCDRSTQACWL